MDNKYNLSTLQKMPNMFEKCMVSHKFIYLFHTSTGQMVFIWGAHLRNDPGTHSETTYETGVGHI